MSGLFGSSAATTDDTTPDLPSTSLRIQTSLEGKPRARGWGQTRIPGNLIWYGDFYAIAQQSSNPASSGGKGGIFSTSQPSASSSSGYNYFASLELAICEGPVASIGPRMWASKATTTLGDSGLGWFSGSGAQTPWSYLTTAHGPTPGLQLIVDFFTGHFTVPAGNHIGEALAYPFTAYVFGNVALGSSAELPNWTFEVTFGVANGAPGVIDACLTDFVADFLSNLISGVAGWGPTFNGDWTNARVYTLAVGLVISYALTDQTSAQSFLSEVLESANLMPVWSDAVLKLVPRGDTQVTGNGVTYVPPAAPLYDLDDSDFLPNQAGFGSSNTDPIAGQRKSPREQDNIVNVEWLDRTSDYNPAIVPAQDDGAILLYGQRNSSGTRSWHWYQTVSAASMAAQLALGREQVANNYSFTLRPRYILLDCGDIVSITDPAIGLFRQWVRILDIQENQDRTLNFLVEECLAGTGAAPTYGREVSTGSIPNYNLDPGGVNPPIVFEPTDQLANGLAIWVAVSGQDQSIYGGCDVWASYDGVTYQRVPGGRIYGDSRMGKLVNPLPAFPVNQTDQTIDNVNTLRVDLTESGGELVSGAQADALALNTACYVGGEIIAYQTATLAGTSVYDLTYLVRNAFGTEDENVLHPAGTDFVRLDNSIVKIPFDQTRIGSSIFLKFLPFNVWGGGGASLSDAPAFNYQITGSALASPLPVVTNVRTVYEAGFSKIWWEEVQDFRTGIRYIIKKGPSYTGAQDLGSLAHPPFVAFGPGVYWIIATAQPLPDLLVFGETPVSITIQGNMLLLNVIQSTDWQAIAWPGTFTNVGKEGTDPTALLRLTATGSFLDLTNVLTTPDILNLGQVATSGSYVTADANVLNIGYVANCYVNASWTSLGIPINSDILSNPDILNTADILSSASSVFVNVWVDIRFATDNVSDVYSPTDIFSVPDVYAGQIQWGAWQRFVPGVYNAQFIQYRVVFQSLSPSIIAYLTTFTTSVTIPPRIDHYVGNSVGTGGITIIFEPDNATAAKPFNGGTLVGGINNHPLPQVTMDWPGHPGVNFVIDALSLSQVTFHFEDGTGTHIALTNVDVVAEGY